MKAQDKHIPQYYAQLEFLPVPITIYELLKSTNKVHIAIDGGAVPLIGSMGFVIADEEGTVLLNMLWTTMRQEPIVVLIRNMCNPSSNKTSHSTYQLLQ